MRQTATYPGRACIALCLATALSMPCCRKGADPSALSAPAHTSGIELAEVHRQDLVVEIGALGQIVYHEKVNVSSRVNGRLVRVLVREGDRIARGSLVAEVERLPLELTLREQLAELDIAKRSCDLVKAKYDNALKSVEIRFKQIEKARTDLYDRKVTWQNMKRALDNREALLKAGGISVSEFENFRAQYTSAQSQHANAGADLAIQEVGFRDSDIAASGYAPPKSAHERIRLIQVINTRMEKAELEAAEARIGQVEKMIQSTRLLIAETFVRAPIGGLVAAKSMEAGEMLRADSVIMTIISISNVFLAMSIGEKDARSLKTGQRVTFTADAFPGATFAGRVSRITPLLDQKTRTIEVKALVENPGGRLLPGMFARASIVTDLRRGVISVPASSLLQRSGNAARVYVVKKGIAFPHDVTLGADGGESVEIASGLDAGDIIVTRGANLVRPEMPVNAAMPEHRAASDGACGEKKG